MSLIKRWREPVMKRMAMAFPELSEEDIAVNMTMANNFEEFFAICMHDVANREEAKRYEVED